MHSLLLLIESGGMFFIQVEKEILEKDRVQSRLDSKISDLTQVVIKKIAPKI